MISTPYITHAMCMHINIRDICVEGPLQDACLIPTLYDNYNNNYDFTIYHWYIITVLVKAVLKRTVIPRWRKF